jgi:hypothetical protein
MISNRDQALEQQAYETQDMQEQYEERSDAELLYKLGFVSVADILKAKYGR